LVESSTAHGRDGTEIQKERKTAKEDALFSIQKNIYCRTALKSK
jgi:hypothetical protein